MADVLRFDIAKDPKGNPITYGRVGDTDGLTRSVKVFEDGKPLDLTGYVITFEGNTSKYKTKVFDTDGITVVDAAKGEFNYTFPNMAFAVEGQYERAYFSFANADKRMTTADFQVIVFGNSDIDAEEAETIITEYNRLLAELHEKQDAYIEEMDQTFLSLTQQLEDLQVQIDDVVARLEAGDFYTKEESDGKFSTKTELSDHVDNKENPHGVTKSQVGLGDVSNYSVATEDEAKAGTADNKYMTPAKVAMFAQNLERKTQKIRIDTFNSDGSYFDGVTSISFADYWVNLKKITLLWGGYRPGEGGKTYGYRSIDYDKQTIERLSGVAVWEPMVAIATGVMSFKSYVFNSNNKTIVGNDANKTDNNRNQTLKEVWAEVYI